MNHNDYLDIYVLMSMIKERSDQFIINAMKKREIHGIVPSHGEIITSLYKKQGSLTMNEIGQQVHKTQATVTVLVKKLEQQGYVIREKDAKDGRVTRVALTNKGNQLAEAVLEIAEELVGFYHQSLEENELRDLQQLMNLLVSK